MAYASQADMIDRFGTVEIQQLTDRELPALGEIDADVLDRALADADGIVDRYLCARYSVPLAPTYPTDIVRIACDIARYMLHDLGAPESVRQHYEDALKWLAAVAEGKLPLIGSGGAIVAPKTDAHGPSAVRPYAEGGTFGAAFAQVWQP
jgi:phage gp36-like protein